MVDDCNHDDDDDSSDDDDHPWLIETFLSNSNFTGLVVTHTSCMSYLVVVHVTDMRYVVTESWPKGKAPKIPFTS